MTTAFARLEEPTGFIQALNDWALRTRSRELYDLVAFGLVAVPLGFLGDPGWWMLATPPLGLSALGGWGLLKRNRTIPAPFKLRLATGVLAVVVFLAGVISLLAPFFLLLSPPPTL